MAADSVLLAFGIGVRTGLADILRAAGLILEPAGNAGAVAERAFFAAEVAAALINGSARIAIGGAAAGGQTLDSHGLTSIVLRRPAGFPGRAAAVHDAAAGKAIATRI
jgi:hypothetical protein